MFAKQTLFKLNKQLGLLQYPWSCANFDSAANVLRSRTLIVGSLLYVSNHVTRNVTEWTKSNDAKSGDATDAEGILNHALATFAALVVRLVRFHANLQCWLIKVLKLCLPEPVPLESDYWMRTLPFASEVQVPCKQLRIILISNYWKLSLSIVSVNRTCLKKI